MAPTVNCLRMFEAGHFYTFFFFFYMPNTYALPNLYNWTFCCTV